MNYTEYKEQQKELKRKIDLEYLQVSEEIKEALCNIERRVKAKNKDEKNTDEIER